METNRINPTTKEIAKLAGVSLGTVDRVLHNRSEVSEETRQRVLKIIKELGYEPNLLASTLARKKKFTIAVLLPKVSKSNPYWQQPLDGIKKAEQEIRQFGIQIQNYLYDYTDEATFKAETAKIIESKPDGIILSPFLFNESQEFVNLCIEKKIPYVLIDSNFLPNESGSFIGQDAFQSGLLAAKLMTQLINNEAHVLIVNITKTYGNSNNLKKRIEGFTSFFESVNTKKRITLSHLQIPDSINPKDIIFDKSLFKENNIEGVFVPNSRAFLIAEHLQKNKIKNIKLIGYDLIKKNIQYLENGMIDYLICQRPVEQGYKAVMEFFNSLVLQKAIAKEILMPIDIITKENITYYLNYE